MNRNEESFGARARAIVKDATALKTKNPLLTVGPMKQAVDVIEALGGFLVEMSDQLDSLTPYLDEGAGQGAALELEPIAGEGTA